MTDAIPIPAAAVLDAEITDEGDGLSNVDPRTGHPLNNPDGSPFVPPEPPALEAGVPVDDEGEEETP